MALAFLTLAARLRGGFLMSPLAIDDIVLADLPVALPMLALVAPRLLAALMALLAAPPVLFPATPFFGAFLCGFFIVFTFRCV